MSLKQSDFSLFMPKYIKYKDYSIARPDVLLQQIMRQNKVSLKQIIEKTGIEKKKMRKIYQGKVLPTRHDSILISKALNLPKFFFDDERAFYLIYRQLILSERYGITNMNETR